jgi:hypothetical protein
MYAPRSCRRRPSRAAELVIGPATSGRTRWRPPQGDGKHAALRPNQIILAARLRARAIPTPSRKARRSGSERKPKGWGHGFSKAYAAFAISNSSTIKNRKQDADKRGSPSAPSGAARAHTEHARLSASHHGSHQRESSSLRLSFRPGFLGRGLTQDRKQRSCAGNTANGRYPPSPVPVQGSTSRPGHNAGRHDAQAAREQGG